MTKTVLSLAKVVGLWRRCGNCIIPHPPLFLKKKYIDSGDENLIRTAKSKTRSR